MNGKKIVGNGSKATLPNGQKLSDKIQENKTKHNVENNSSRGNKGTSTTNGSSEGKDNKKSKGQQTAQAAGTEAAKEALKKAAGTIPYTKWIPKGIRDKIIDKFMDSDAGQAAVDKAFKKIKMKVMMIVVSAVASIAMSIIMIGAMYGLIAAPVAWISDALGDIGNFFSKMGNWFSGDGWCSGANCNQNASAEYYSELEKAVKTYGGDCKINEDLITATIFYGQMVSAEKNMSENEDYENIETSYNFLDVTEGSGSPKASEQINKLVKVYLRGEGMSKEDLDSDKEVNVVIDEDNPCSISTANYRNYLIDTYIDWGYPSAVDYIKSKQNVNEEKAKEIIADEILQMGEIKYLGSDGGGCTGSCSYEVDGKNISNLKVKLLQGTDMDFGEPIEGEELVPFEKYILGVVYGEVGSEAKDEVAKTQAVAARSYALTREKHIGGDVGLHQENGEWILYIRNSTEDQVYCDPDKGCSKIGDVNSTVFSDPDKYNFYKGPLAADAKLRKYVSEVIGELAHNSSGEIVYTPYTQTNQDLWESLASEGKNYTDILTADYKDNGFSKIYKNPSCSKVCSFATGDYTEWYQSDPRWGSIVIGHGEDGKVYTMGNAGCLITAVAKQIARSGVETPLGADFNPGTLITKYKNTLVNSGASWRWDGITTVIPNFVYNSSLSYDNIGYKSMSEHITLLQKGINQGCYYVVEVKSHNAKSKNTTHYVAIDTIADNEIYIMETGSNKNNTTISNSSSDGYKYHISIARCYQVKE